MLSADHLNIDGPPLAVMCVRKFRSVLGGEVTYKGMSVCVCLCLHNVPRADIVHVLHMRSADLRPRADTLEVRCWLYSDSDSSCLQTQELTIKLWGYTESALGIEIIS